MARRKLAIGDFRDQVTIQAPIAPGSAEYVDVAPDCWAHVAAVGSWERLQAASVQAAVDYRVTLRDCPVRLEAAMRLVWTTSTRLAPVVLQVTAAPIEEGSEVTVDCVEAHP
jgi:head-tail adaptor